MQLTNVQFGNTYEVDDLVTLKRTLDGDLKVMFESARPVIEKFNVTMYPLNTQQKDDWESFFLGAAAQQVRMLDHESKTWIGIINNDPTITDRGRGCKFQIEFEFEGRRTA